MSIFEEMGRAGVALPLARQALEDQTVALASRETALQASIAKLSHAEEAIEGDLTCMECMNVFTAPVTCVPSGQNFCGGACAESGCAGSDQYIPDSRLD